MNAFSSSRVRTSTTRPRASTFDAFTSSSTAAARNRPSISSLELLADLPDDVGAQLVERVELGRGVRELVVERRQHLLVQLLERDERRARGCRRRPRQATCVGVAGGEAANPVLELVDQALRAELDHVVALARALLGHDVDDRDVAVARGPPVDRRRARRPIAAAPRAAASTTSSGTSTSSLGTSSFVQSAGSRLRLHGNSAVNSTPRLRRSAARSRTRAARPAAGGSCARRSRTSSPMCDSTASE